MSSTEPPSRNAPRNQPQDTKAARDELSSKGKVEKVREIDADEQTRKQRFLKFYRDEATEDENMEAENRPSPFDLLSGKPPQTENPPKSLSTSAFGDDVENAIVPGPTYTPPPSVNSFEGENEASLGENAATEGALPQSDDFWEDVDFLDQPPLPTNFQETPGLTKQASFEPPPQRTGKVPQEQKKGEARAAADLNVGVKKGKGVVEKGGTLPASQEKSRSKNPEASPFGPPGKRVAPSKGNSEEKKLNEPVQRQTAHPKEAPSKKLPSPFEPVQKTPTLQPKGRLAEEEEKEPYAGPIQGISKEEKKEIRQPTKEEIYPNRGDPAALPIRSEEKEPGGDGNHKNDRGKEQKIVEIESPSLPTLPAQVQPLAMTALSQAAPYLNPSTVSLFFQMVGTMFVMAGPQGINRTEIVLNNPAYASSKFFGSTITIEKYATAPDSFNIRLTGSHEAVVSFKENIPSLMSAFENGNFAFRVNRLDAEYSFEKPIFHRKEKGGDKGEAGGGDLGERRK